MNAFIIELENTPGSLADTAAAIAEKGININGVAGATSGGIGTIAIVTNDESATRSALQGIDCSLSFEKLAAVAAGRGHAGIIVRGRASAQGTAV